MWLAPTALGYVTSPFDPARVHPITGKVTPHTGTDYRATTGTPIRAAAAGYVIRSAYDPPRAQGGTGAGNHVRIDHGGGITTRYYHLSARHVAVGDKVNTGTVIGLAGNTGDSTAAHLHFEVRVNNAPTDPVPWLAARTTSATPAADAPEPTPEPQEEPDMVIVKDVNGVNHWLVGPYSVELIGTTDHLKALQVVYPTKVANAAEIQQLIDLVPSRLVRVAAGIAKVLPTNARTPSAEDIASAFISHIKP